MLTKNCLRHKIVKGVLKPRYLALDDSPARALGQSLIDTFAEGKGRTQESLLETTSLLITGSECESTIGKGFEKLCLDRATFNASAHEALPALREATFKKTFALMASAECPQSLAIFQAAVACGTDYAPQALADKLYADLPMYNMLEEFKPLTLDALLHRYNCALVQGYLAQCERLVVRIKNESPQGLRRLFRYARFFQLLADTRWAQKGTLELVFDGPLSLFFQTQKYGLNLANFFPAILLLGSWELEATVSLQPGHTVELRVGSECGISSHYQQLTAYVPEEIEMFARAFTKKKSLWSLTQADDFVDLGQGVDCFPDFTLTHTGDGRATALEVFHPWHAKALLKRLTQLESATQPLVILAVARKLLKDELIAQATLQSRYFSQWGIEFREMPTTDQLLDVLQRVPLPALVPAARKMAKTPDMSKKKPRASKGPGKNQESNELTECK